MMGMQVFGLDPEKLQATADNERIMEIAFRAWKETEGFAVEEKYAVLVCLLSNFGEDLTPGQVLLAAENHYRRTEGKLTERLGVLESLNGVSV